MVLNASPLMNVACSRQSGHSQAQRAASSIGQPVEFSDCLANEMSGDGLRSDSGEFAKNTGNLDMPNSFAIQWSAMTNSFANPIAR